MSPQESLGGKEHPRDMERALDTMMPDHFRPGIPRVISVAQSGEELVLIRSVKPATILCKGTYPEQVEVTGDGGLYTSCPACGNTFVWIYRTRVWS